MKSTLDDLIEFEGEKFLVNRTGKILLGIRDDNVIHFYPDSDIRPNDIINLISTNENFYIIDVKSLYFLKKIDSLEAKYLTETEFKNRNTENQSTNKPTTIFNITNANNSVIGTNPVGNYNFGFTGIEKLIEKKSTNIHEFDAFLAVLKNTLETERCPKGIMANFSDLLKKHSWLSSPVAQLLLSHFFAK